MRFALLSSTNAIAWRSHRGLESFRSFGAGLTIALLRHVDPSSRAARPSVRPLPLAPAEIAVALRRHAFLFGLSDAQLASIAQIAEPVEFHEQERVLSARKRSLDFYLVLTGSVSIELNHKHYAVRIQSLGPGDAFGWSALLDEHDTLFDVRTREYCTALRLEGKRLSSVLNEDPVLAAALLRRTLGLVAGRLHATEIRLGELCGVRMKTNKMALPTIPALNKLVEVCLDGELGYRTAAEHVKGSNLRTILTEHSVRRGQFAQELRAEVERLGGTPSNSGTLAASLHRGWITLRSAILGGNAKAIIIACQTGESAAQASYQEALSSDALTAETRSMVEAQALAIDQSCLWLQEIDNELASGGHLESLDRRP